MALRHRLTRKKVLVPLLVVVIAGGAALTYHHYHKPAATQPPVPKGTTSKPTPHEVPAQSTTNNRQGGVIDKNGRSSGSLPPASQWKKSDSGNITLQLPTAGNTVKSGDSLVGLAKVDNIQFILKDDAVGLISQGNLKVVDGKFSGVLQFTPHAGTGKLEVYYPDPQSGAEKDIISIDVNLST